MEKLYIPFAEIELKTDNTRPGYFVGYGATFGNKDLGNDIILPGAFDQTIKEHEAEGTVPSMFYEHNSQEPIGDWLSMGVDKKGLKMEGQLWVGSNIGRADQAYKMLQSKTGRGLSIGFSHITPPIYDDKKGTRQLTSLRVHETSPTNRPMNQKAKILSVKSLLEEKKIITVREAEDWLRDEVGLSATEAKTFIAAVKSGAMAERDASDERKKLLEQTLNDLRALRT